MGEVARKTTSDDLQTERFGLSCIVLGAPDSMGFLFGIAEVLSTGKTKTVGKGAEMEIRETQRGSTGGGRTP